ncbi:MAG: hypothetical protein KAH46_09750, partial [Mycobacterium sp.]|nr:hypothetical protein [Mycobacterium sp.]
PTRAISARHQRCWAARQTLTDPDHVQTAAQLRHQFQHRTGVTEPVIALIELPQVCSLKFLTCEQRSV